MSFLSKSSLYEDVPNTFWEILRTYFTLYANTDKGNRPSYIEALESSKAKVLYELFNEKLGKEIKVETGMFGEDMQVEFINDGPVTILLEREDKNV